jgi:hypothetical protein
MDTTLHITCGSLKKTINFPSTNSVAELKRFLAHDLRLVPASIKLMGPKGVVKNESATLESCGAKGGVMKLNVIGTASSEMAQLQDAESAFEVKRILEQERLQELQLAALAEARRVAAELKAREDREQREREIRHQEAAESQRRREAERKVWEQQQAALEIERNRPRPVKLEFLAFSTPRSEDPPKIALPASALTAIIDNKVDLCPKLVAFLNSNNHDIQKQQP